MKINAGLYILVGVLLSLGLSPSSSATEVRESRAPSAINRAAVVMSKPSSVFGSNIDIAPELLSSYNEVKATEKPFDAAQVLPMDMRPTESSGEVFSRVADQSLSSFFNSPQMRASPIGQTATKVEHQLKQDVVLGRGAIEHKVSFQVQAFQGIARVDYSGLTHACLKYQASESSLGLEVSEKIARGQDLVVSHVAKPADRLSSVSMRWNF